MIGIIGGMGPRASAPFLNTIYAYDQGHEIHAPSVILHSVSGAPNRNAAVAGRGEEDLVSHIQRAGDILLDAGVLSVIIACVTAHAFIPRLSLALQERIISLVDVALREVENRSNSLLLLCSEGSRRAQLFESHQLWPAVRHKVTLPTPRHQRRVDEMIVSIKSRGIFAREVSQCRRLLNDYGVDGFYFGMHGVSLAKHKICWASSLVKRNGCRSPRNLGRYYGKQPRSWATPARSIDPAQIGAKEIKRYCLGKEDVDKFLTIASDKQGFSAWLYNRILNFGRTSAHLTDSKNIKCPAQRRSASVPEFASDNLVRCHRRPLRLHCLHCTPLHTTV